ncbi:hypothetical protein [Candidatus Nitrosotenuis chungbukensis]|uniref:hypothetical protein n=2 Tax=Candidatus Nitrosotenuis chungbukensis TaxID=1353246 RepID=UPI0012FE9569|nr:hypothetical protein [Candidatus Nitrosotenuis chungbukensis]
MDHKISVSFTVFVLLLGLSGYSISNASSINNVDPLYGSHTMKLAFAESHNSDGESEDEDHDEQESESEGEDTEDEESEEIDEETESEDSDERDSEEDANKAISDAEDEIKKSQEKIAEAKEKGKITSASEAVLEEAQGKLEEAKQNLESGFFQMAEELADEAEDLASDARMNVLGKNIEDEIEGADEEEIEEQETEIEVEIKNGKTKVTIEFEDEKSKFLLDTTDESVIISAIIDKTGLDESEIRDIWDFEIEDEDSDTDDSTQTARVENAKQDAQDRVSELEQKIDQLEQRIQSLLQRLETGAYFGRMGDPESITESFNISFDGSATSIGDTTAADFSGEIFVESLSTSNNVSTFRVTGGELFVGDELYDVVFGKMRIISHGDPNTNDTILLISEVIDEQDHITTLRLSLTSEVSLDGDLVEPVNLKMLSPQSKIAGQWFLDASAQMTPLNS